MQKFDLRNSIGARLFVITVLVFALLVPTSMISNLINERENRRNDAVKEVSSKWGAMQVICGPILTVPYRIVTKDSSGKFTSTSKHFIKVLPESLKITGEIDPKIRYRGIYEIVLYGTNLSIQGSFSRPDLAALGVAPSTVDWSGAYLSIGISDMKGIRDAIKIDVNGTLYMATPGTKTSEVGSGVSINLPMDPLVENLAFGTEISVNGSEQLDFIPLGKETNIDIKSTWKDPSFTGEFLPVSRVIGKNGFTATWKIFNLNRNFPQTWTHEDYSLSKAAFGVGLLLPVDGYQKTTRTNKYALMFILLTFLAFFMTEILGTRALHPMQYLLIGAGQVIFYTLLLSLTEHVPFSIAYLISSLSLVSLISLYSINILKNKVTSLVVFVLISLLYVYLYVVLQMQDYALLLGSVGLFTVLATLMYTTRNLDWFTLFSKSKSGEIDGK